MAFQTQHVPANLGHCSTVMPFKDVRHVAAVKELLADRPRDLALFTVGVNSAFRASDLLNLRRADLLELADGRYEVMLQEKKTKRVRRVTLNLPTSAVLRRHLEVSCGEFVFEGQRGQMTVRYLWRLVK